MYVVYTTCSFLILYIIYNSFVIFLQNIKKINKTRNNIVYTFQNIIIKFRYYIHLFHFVNYNFKNYKN